MRNKVKIGNSPLKGRSCDHGHRTPNTRRGVTNSQEPISEGSSLSTLTRSLRIQTGVQSIRREGIRYLLGKRCLKCLYEKCGLLGGMVGGSEGRFHLYLSAHEGRP